MKFEEIDILKKIFWPREQENHLGNLLFNQVDENFINIKSIGASRTENKLEIFYCVAPLENTEKKDYFIKLIFDRIDNSLLFNQKKSSPEIKTDQDVQDVFKSIQNSILLMNSQPDFFMTGILKQQQNKPSI